MPEKRGIQTNLIQEMTVLSYDLPLNEVVFVSTTDLNLFYGYASLIEISGYRGSL